MPIAWHEFSSRDELDQRLATAAAQRLRTQLKQRGTALLAVSGGSTPKGMFAQLAQQDLRWDQITVSLVDERFVPADHEDSNQRLINDHLRQGPASQAQLLPMYGAVELKSAAQVCAAQLQKYLPCAQLILGMGTDGHTASWFPDSPQLDQVTDSEGARLVAAVTTPSSPHPRLTMTLAAVLRSEQLVLHITGAEKRSVLEANLTGDSSDPIARIVKRPGVTVDVYWVA